MGTRPKLTNLPGAEWSNDGLIPARSFGITARKAVRWGGDGYGYPSVELSKIDIAAQHLKAAVRLFFEDVCPAAAYLLAASAREITTTLADQIGIDPLLGEAALSLGIDRSELIREYHKFARNLKHANRDPHSKTKFTLQRHREGFVCFVQ